MLQWKDTLVLANSTHITAVYPGLVCCRTFSSIKRLRCCQVLSRYDCCDFILHLKHPRLPYNSLATILQHLSPAPALAPIQNGINFGMVGIWDLDASI